MVMNMMPHQHHPPTPPPHPSNHPPQPPPPPPLPPPPPQPVQPSPSTTAKRSPSATNSLSLVPLSSRDHVAIPLPPVAVAHSSTESTPSLAVARVRLSDISTYDGAPSGQYNRAVDALAGSLTRHNSAVIELAAEDTAVIRCGLEAARLYLKTRGQSHQSGGSCSGGANGKGSAPSSRGTFMYRAGRAIEDWDSSPPCMAEVFKCMGRAARAALCAIARHLRLRSDGFMHLLDDAPLPANEVSSSVLVASCSVMSSPNGNNSIGVGKQANGEVEKGLLTLISSDYPGLQVCDPNGRWYLADAGSSPGDLLLLTGKALSHVTAGLRPAGIYRATPDNSSLSSVSGRTSLSFRLMPHVNAILDCTPIAAAGHIIPQSYVPISVSQFMDNLSTEEDVFCRLPVNSCVAENKTNKDPTLRSVLSDHLSGAFLEDAMLVSCGHSFGGLMLKKVIEMSRCTICNAEIDSSRLTPNHALRAAATAVKHEDDRRLFHNATLRKRRREMGDHPDSMRRFNRENGESGVDNGLHRGVQYPFAVNEKVMIEGNKRTPEKFVGKEAIITSQCLNGWYLLKIIGSGENVRLQYRSLRKIQFSEAMEDRCPPLPLQNGGS